MTLFGIVACKIQSRLWVKTRKSSWPTPTSALPPKAEVSVLSFDVCFGAINGHGRLFDHLIGAGKQRGRHGEVERFGGLEIDCQLEFRGYFDWQLTWLFAAQYSIDIECGTAEQVDI